jgi:hypothetical protein
MQQRVSLCRSLIHEPALLMLDEPFAALDAFTREELWCVLRDLWQKLRFTVILVTHDLREAAFLADNIYVMSARPGSIVQVKPVDFPRPRSLAGYLRKGLRRHRSRAAREDRAGDGSDEPRTRRKTGALAVHACDLFLIWEAACHLFPDQPFRIAAAFGGLRRDGAHWKTFAYHSYVTLWVTMVGFALAVAFGILLGPRGRLVAHDLSRALSGDGRLQHDPEGRDRAAPDPVVRHRRGAGDHHRVPDLVLSRSS